MTAEEKTYLRAKIDALAWHDIEEVLAIIDRIETEEVVRKSDILAMIHEVDDDCDRDRHNTTGEYRQGWDNCIETIEKAVGALKEVEWLDKPTEPGWWWILEGKTSIPAKVVLNTYGGSPFFEIWAWGINGWATLSEAGEIYNNPKWQKIELPRK